MYIYTEGGAQGQLEMEQRLLAIPDQVTAILDEIARARQVCGNMDICTYIHAMYVCVCVIVYACTWICSRTRACGCTNEPSR